MFDFSSSAKTKKPRVNGSLTCFGDFQAVEAPLTPHQEPATPTIPATELHIISHDISFKTTKTKKPQKSKATEEEIAASLAVHDPPLSKRET